MLPSGRLFLNRDDIYENNRRARQRAKWLYEYACAYTDKAAEFGGDLSEPVPDPKHAFPGWRRKDPDKDDTELQDQWGVVAEVAEDYPRLLAWLAEGPARAVAGGAI